jgi:hypothetical protein
MEAEEEGQFHDLKMSHEKFPSKENEKVRNDNGYHFFSPNQG